MACDLGWSSQGLKSPRALDFSKAASTAKDLPAGAFAPYGARKCAWSNRICRIVRRGGHHGFVITYRSQELMVAVAQSPWASGRINGNPVSGNGSLHAGRKVRLSANAIGPTVSAWLAELGANSPMVEDLARAVRDGDWPVAYAVGEHLSVDIAIAA